MKPEVAGPLAAVDLPGLVRNERLRLICDQVRRVPAAIFLLDAFVFFLIQREGAWHAAALWLFATTGVQAGRALYARRLCAAGFGDAAVAMRRIDGIFLVNGLVRAAIVPIAFALPAMEVQYLTTMVLIGVAAGGVGVVGGNVRTYLMWAVPVGSVLALGWLLRLDFEGSWIALLLLLLFAVLTLYVREQGNAIARLVQLAHEKQTLSESLARERDRVELERQRAEVEREKAQAASDAKTRFFAAASHDLRQPLFALSLNHTTLEQLAQRSGDDMLERVSQSMQRNLEQASSLLHQLMDKATLDAGAVDLQMEALELRELLEAVQSVQASAALSHGLELRIDAPMHASPWVSSDRKQLLRVLNNLVGNAIKFTPAGAITLHVERERGGQVTLAVIDTGIGIAPQEHERVFEEFYQIGNPERDRSKGLGLGLSIVRRLCQMLGIELRLDSAPGTGTTFELRLPAAEAPAGAVIDPTQHSGPLPLNGLDRLRVLVVDDEEDVLGSMRTLADSLGWTMAGAAGPEPAKQLLRDGFAPDIALVDFRLRGGRTGLDVVRLLREAGCHAPALIVTGDTAPQRVAEMRDAGLDVVFKPIDGHGLLRAIRGVLRRDGDEARLAVVDEGCGATGAARGAG